MILPEFFDACDHCGDPFERDTTYPVLTTDDHDDGTMQLYSFCDDECLTSWREADGSMDEFDGGEAQT